MYHRILVTLDTTPTDQVILEHIRPLAKMCNGSIVLLHVADGWAARQFKEDAVSREIHEDQKYLEGIQAELAGEGFQVETHLAFGDPVAEIVKWIETEHCDLLAMSTHGHRLFGDLIFGSTASRVQHRVNVPVLMIRACGKGDGGNG